MLTSTSDYVDLDILVQIHNINNTNFSIINLHTLLFLVSFEVYGTEDREGSFPYLKSYGNRVW
jgi:hypothetical protein